MFSSKKNTLPPRPSLPLPAQILEDLQQANAADVAFTIMKTDSSQCNDLHFPTNANDAENIYGKARRYLDGIQRLKILTEVLSIEENRLQADYQEIVQLAQDIRDEAQAVLIK